MENAYKKITEKQDDNLFRTKEDFKEFIEKYKGENND